MARTADYSEQSCSVAAALEVVGDPWTLLIIRDVLTGRRRFEEFQASLGCARNVLAARLKSLVEQGLLVRRPYNERPLRYEYAPTDKSKDLYAVIIMLTAWGDKHVYGKADIPVRLTHDCGAELEPQLTCAACHRPATPRTLTVERLPGACKVAEALSRLTPEAA